ncbi:hypothetical protein QBC38DRAFT_120059 [Podospora fimiseda]|uniref:Cyanovirin-N domain-containing protein n=1 Tax=Podospora fimiseda TaxID=252190 RepID=A0AAN7BTP0_9PEZI|nr:hypothetical protein QBC38DRAFT_120059 [Podospora fimiseda]
MIIFKMQFSILALCLAAFLSTHVTAWDSHVNFTFQCKDIFLDGRQSSLLTACCLTDSNSDTGVVHGNTYASTFFDLALCVGINYTTATLEWSMLGKYPLYCNDCQLINGGSGLNCVCQSTTEQGQLVVNSTLDLNQGVANVNGNLACQWY